MEKYLSDLAARYPALDGTIPPLRTLIGDTVALFRRGGTLFVAGNGGSAADAEHICGELLKGFKSRRKLSEDDKRKFTGTAGEEGKQLADTLQYGLPAISLLSHPALSSAFANDCDPLSVFAQQLWALGRADDMVIGISTGGGAENIRRLFIAARAKRIRTVLLTGAKNGRCREFADLVVAAPDTETYRIQELHLPLYHTLCLAVESHFFEMTE